MILLEPFRLGDQILNQLNCLLKGHSVPATLAVAGAGGEEAVFYRNAAFFKVEENVWIFVGNGTVKLWNNGPTKTSGLEMRQGLESITLNSKAVQTMRVCKYDADGACFFWDRVKLRDGDSYNELLCIKFHCAEDCNSFLERAEEIGELRSSEPVLPVCTICRCADGIEGTHCNCLYKVCKDCQRKCLRKSYKCEKCKETWTLEISSPDSPDNIHEHGDESDGSAEMEGYPD